MPKSFEYPKSNDGKYLYLLAQINFAEVPKLEGFPDRGILQFYLEADEELYGCNFDNPSNQDKFRVIYFPKIDLNIDNLVTDFSFLPKLESEDWLMPFQGCCSLEFTIAYSPITLSDSQFNIFPEYSHQYDIPDYLYNTYYDLFCIDQYKLGGYPNFIQQDPRTHWNEEIECSILLFQMGSSTSKAIDIMWADGGIGNFFIKKSDLDKLDFSKVIYNWDCG